MSQNVKGTFFTNGTGAGAISDVLVPPTGVAQLALRATGLDANNKIQPQKSTNNGQTWAAEGAELTSDTTGSIAVAAGTQYRLACTAQEVGKVMEYSLSAES